MVTNSDVTIQNFFAPAAKKKTAKQVRTAIYYLEKELSKFPQIKPELKHYIAGGMYARELFLAKNSVVTGQIHLKEHLVHVSFGTLIVVEETGTTLVRGPCTFVGKAGTKRAVLVKEDTLWTAFHTTTKTTVEECEKEVVTNDYNLYLGAK